MIGAEGNAVTDLNLLKQLISWEPVNVNPKYIETLYAEPAAWLRRHLTLLGVLGPF